MMTNKQIYLPKKVAAVMSALSLSLISSACSFVELNPAANHIILANDKKSCSTLENFNAEVNTSNFFIDRSERAIAEDLQTLALNKAYEMKANAIWPTTEVEAGKQSFDILHCKNKR